MKVLFISRLYPNEYDNRIGTVIHSQALELKKNGVDVRVISPLPYTPKIVKNIKPNWNIYHSLPKITEYQGIKVYHPRFIKIPFALYDESMYKFMKKSIEKIIETIYNEFPFDLIHAHMGYPDSLIGLHLKKRFNVPLITTIRSSDTDRRSKQEKIKQLLYDNLPKSNVIISPSIQIANKAKKLFNTASIHVGNGIYPELIKKEIKSTKLDQKILEKLKDKRILISISRLVHTKGIQYNIRAIAKLINENPKLLYLIIGDGPEKRNLESLVDKLNLNNNVIFLGNLEHNVAMKFLSISDIFSLPSWIETFGLVYLEAMFLKKPIILSKNEALDGIVKHNKDGIIIPPHSVDDLSYNIKRLLSDKKLYTSITNRGKNLVLSNYTWDEIGKKLIKIYLNTIER